MTVRHLPIVPRLIPLMAIVCMILPACSPAPGEPKTVVSQAPSSATPSPTPEVVTLPANTGAVESPAPASPTETEASSARPLLVTPPTTNCPVSTAIVADPESPLNVRSSPTTQAENAENNIVGQVEDQTFVTVIGEQDGWFEIDAPVAGWIAQNRTRYSCALVDEAIDLNSPQNQVRVQGEMIGTGSHQYRIQLATGQTLKIENEAEVFPRIIAPDNQSLDEEIVGTDTKEWSIPITIAGEYLLQLDSNFRGFSYQFLVTVQQSN